jgi:hypothetical protein
MTSLFSRRVFILRIALMLGTITSTLGWRLIAHTNFKTMRRHVERKVVSHDGQTVQPNCNIFQTRELAGLSCTWQGHWEDSRSIHHGSSIEEYEVMSTHAQQYIVKKAHKRFTQQYVLS